MAAKYLNSVTGVLVNGVGNGTTITDTSFVNFPTVTAPDVMKLSLDVNGVGGLPEVVYVTAHAAASNTMTVTRGAEVALNGAGARTHNVGVAWAHTVTAVDANQLVIACTSATRPANPTVGMLIYETDTFRVMQYQSATTGWTPPWNLPWGANLPLHGGSGQSGISFANITANSANFTSTQFDIAGLSVAFNTVAGRMYKAEFSGMVSTTVPGDTVDMLIVRNGVTELQCRVNLPGTGTQTVTGFYTFRPGTGSQTIKISGQRVAGTGNCAVIAGSTVPATLLVADIGPNTDPA